MTAATVKKPWWVLVSLLGLSTRRSVWACLWFSIAVAIATPSATMTITVVTTRIFTKPF